MIRMFLMQAPKEQPTTPAEAAKAVAALRAQVHNELQNKKQCSYQPYECTQLSLDGYNYCLRHILIDKSQTAYKQCMYVYANNSKRCYLPAPKGDKKDLGYCSEHALKTHLLRSKQGTKQQPPRSAEVLLQSLSYYVKKPKTRSHTSNQHHDENEKSGDEHDAKTTRSLDPFVDMDAAQINASCSDILDMCSESESDVEPANFSSVWQDADAESSDNESVDSDYEDPLKHANIYSAEEITSIARDKLVRLQSLYIDQYQHLQHMLREKRRRYLHALKREKETCCSISNQTRDTPKEQRMYKKLRAYNQYHRKRGVDAILRKRQHEMRLKVTEGIPHKPQSYQSKCSFTEGGVKCTEKALPVARHCRKHILEDPNQVLFRACGKLRAEIECPTPVEGIFEDQTCVLHRDIPPIRTYSQIRKNSESDYEDASDNLSYINQQNPNVKTEYMSNFLATPPGIVDAHEGMVAMDTQEACPVSDSGRGFHLKEESHFDMDIDIGETCVTTTQKKEVTGSEFNDESLKESVDFDNSNNSSYQNGL